MGDSGVDSIKGSDPIKRALQAILESIIGRAGFTALNYHLKRFLGEDPLIAFYNRPKSFHGGLVQLFGESGAAIAFKILCEKLISLSGFEHLTSEEIYDLMLRDEEAAKRVLRQMLEEIVREHGRSVA